MIVIRIFKRLLHRVYGLLLDIFEVAVHHFLKSVFTETIAYPELGVFLFVYSHLLCKVSGRRRACSFLSEVDLP